MASNPDDVSFQDIFSAYAEIQSDPVDPHYGALCIQRLRGYVRAIAKEHDGYDLPDFAKLKNIARTLAEDSNNLAQWCDTMQEFITIAEDDT